MSRNDHLVDTPIKLATCNRCSAYVYLAHASGVRAAADVAAADRDAYIAALVDGRRTFDLLEAAGRPQKLLARLLTAPAPQYDENGAQTAAQGRRKVLVEHGCGGRAQNMLRFAEIEQGPPPARATPGSSRAGGPHPPAAHASGGRTSFPAGCVSPHLSNTNPGTSDLRVEALAAWDAINGGPPPNDTGETLWSSSRTENAASPGRGPDAPIAPAVTRPSVPTSSATGTGLAPSGLTDAAQTPHLSGSSTATASGAAPGLTPRSGRSPGAKPGRCDICRQLVKPGELYWGIQHGEEWIYCEHDECP